MVARHRVRGHPHGDLRGSRRERRGPRPQIVTASADPDPIRPAASETAYSAPWIGVQQLPKPPLPDRVRELLPKPNPSVITTVRPDGQPVSVATWYLWHDGRFLVNMDEGRKRLEYLRNDPRVTLTVLDVAPGTPTSASKAGWSRSATTPSWPTRIAWRGITSECPTRSASVGESAPGSRSSAGTGGAPPRTPMSSTTERGTAWSTTPWTEPKQGATGAPSRVPPRGGRWPRRRRARIWATASSSVSNPSMRELYRPSRPRVR
jgi:hypothetical protein